MQSNPRLLAIYRNISKFTSKDVTCTLDLLTSREPLATVSPPERGVGGHGPQMHPWISWLHPWRVAPWHPFGGGTYSRNTVTAVGR